MTPQRSIKIDVASDITIPIKTSLAVIIARDPLGLDVVERKNIDFVIDYIKPESGYSSPTTTVTGTIRGYTGSQGNQGAQGPRGVTGALGSTGATGPLGSVGSQGLTGAQGNIGISGVTGYTGSQGLTGALGNVGFTGSVGSVGSRGNLGPQGFTGSVGRFGIFGARGNTGFTGSQGYTGSAFGAFRHITVSGQTTITAMSGQSMVDLYSGTGINLKTGVESIRINNCIGSTAPSDHILINTGACATTTSEKLRFNGSNLSVIGGITATGTITSAFSDDRLKTKMGNITNALDRVSKLTGFYYKPNDTAISIGYNDDKMHVGLSAQEVDEVLPEVVVPSPLSDAYRTIKYSRLVALLVEAIKEQQVTIDDLKRRADALS